MKIEQKQNKRYWFQLEVENKSELSYNSLKYINYLDNNIKKE